MSDFAEHDELEEYHDKGPALISTVPRGRVKVVREKGGGKTEKTEIKLRACLLCRIVMSETQFYEDGCPNCPSLQLDGDKHRVFDCTTVNFSGLLAVTNPEKSWVARYNRLGPVVAGCYATAVVGELPESARDDLDRHGQR